MVVAWMIREHLKRTTSIAFAKHLKHFDESPWIRIRVRANVRAFEIGTTLDVP